MLWGWEGKLEKLLTEEKPGHKLGSELGSEGGHLWLEGTGLSVGVGGCGGDKD